MINDGLSKRKFFICNFSPWQLTQRWLTVACTSSKLTAAKTSVDAVVRAGHKASTSATIRLTPATA
jgi:hypothetical protein